MRLLHVNADRNMMMASSTTRRVVGGGWFFVVWGWVTLEILESMEYFRVQRCNVSFSGISTLRFIDAFEREREIIYICIYISHMYSTLIHMYILYIMQMYI